MDVTVDHYNVLGLPSGEEGAKLSEKEISKAYRLKALELHPDKRPDDPQAQSNFQNLKTSYEILKDEKARKLFDELLQVKREQVHRKAQYDVKRRRMVSDLEEREWAANAPDPASKAREEEERIAKKLKEEIARIRAMFANKRASSSRKEATETRRESVANSGGGLNKEKVLKVSWEKSGEDYTAEKLREVFAKFGEVEDVVIKSSRKKGSALVVMASKEAVVTASGNVCGHISNPLLVLPLQSTVAMEFPPRSMEPEPSSNLVGAGYQSFEESILKKLQKAAEKQK